MVLLKILDKGFYLIGHAFAENPRGADFYTPFAPRAVIPVCDYNMLMPQKTNSAYDFLRAEFGTFPASLAPFRIYPKIICADFIHPVIKISHKYLPSLLDGLWTGIF
jgi:hypothetical protein